MAYADLVDASTGSGQKIFSSLTARFTRAQYSSGSFDREYTLKALEEYNHVLTALTRTQNLVVFGLRYLAIFMRRIPFRIVIKTHPQDDLAREEGS